MHEETETEEAKDKIYRSKSRGSGRRQHGLIRERA
jgi:hypothetical protein